MGIKIAVHRFEFNFFIVISRRKGDFDLSLTFVIASCEADDIAYACVCYYLCDSVFPEDVVEVEELSRTNICLTVVIQ